MTESIFDPKSGQTEHSGSTFTPPQADDLSHFPPDLKHGRLAKQEAAENADASEPQGVEDAPNDALQELARAEEEHDEDEI